MLRTVPLNKYFNVFVREPASELESVAERFLDGCTSIPGKLNWRSLILVKALGRKVLVTSLGL